MNISFEFEGEEVAEVMEAIALHMQRLTRGPATAEQHAKVQRLARFAHRMGPVIERGMAEANRQDHAHLN